MESKSEGHSGIWMGCVDSRNTGKSEHSTGDCLPKPGEPIKIRDHQITAWRDPFLEVDRRERESFPFRKKFLISS